MWPKNSWARVREGEGEREGKEDRICWRNEIECRSVVNLFSSWPNVRHFETSIVNALCVFVLLMALEQLKWINGQTVLLNGMNFGACSCPLLIHFRLHVCHLLIASKMGNATLHTHTWWTGSQETTWQMLQHQHCQHKTKIIFAIKCDRRDPFPATCAFGNIWFALYYIYEVVLLSVFVQPFLFSQVFSSISANNRIIFNFPLSHPLLCHNRAAPPYPSRRLSNGSRASAAIAVAAAACALLFHFALFHGGH